MFHSKTEKNSDLRSYSVSVSVAGGGEKKDFFPCPGGWRPHRTVQNILTVLNTTESEPESNFTFSLFACHQGVLTIAN